MMQHTQNTALEIKRWTLGDVIVVTGLSFIIMLSGMIVYNMISSRRKDESRYL